MHSEISKGIDVSRCLFVLRLIQYLHRVNKAIKISSVFSKHLFWDVKLEQLDAERDQDLIVPRALFMTDEQSFIHDIEKLELIYSSAEIIDTLKTTKERISNKVCELVAHRYDIPVFHRYSN